MSAPVHVVIAAYNEAKVLGGVVADLKRAGYRVIVVDDGSSDNSAAIAGEAGARCAIHPINLGQGAALQTGLSLALRDGAETIVTFDADGQHRSADIAPSVAALRAANAHFALGSRFLGTSLNIPASRRALLKAATVFTRITTGLRVTDAHNGFRIMSRRGAQAISLRQNRMAHASEILHQIAVSGLPYVEVPVTIEYTEYSLSKGQRMADALTILVDLFARRLHR